MASPHGSDDFELLETHFEVTRYLLVERQVRAEWDPCDLISPPQEEMLEVHVGDGGDSGKEETGEKGFQA
jgi:hypothetical protein